MVGVFEVVEVIVTVFCRLIFFTSCCSFEVFEGEVFKGFSI